MGKVFGSINLFVFRKIIVIDVFIVISDLLMINYSLRNKLFEVRHICKDVLVKLCLLAVCDALLLLTFYLRRLHWLP